MPNRHSSRFIALAFIALVLVVVVAITHESTTLAMSFLSNASLAKGLDNIECSCTDEGGNIFFGTWTAPGSVNKVAMQTLTNLGTLYLNKNEDYVSAVVYDFNNYLYAATYSSPTAFVIKVHTVFMNRVGSVALPSRNLNLDPDPSAIDGQLHKISAGLFLPAPQNALLFSTDTQPTRLVRIPISDFSFKAENVYTLQNQEDSPAVFVLSKRFLLVGLQKDPAQVVQLDPTTLVRQFTLTFNSGESYISTGFHMGALPTTTTTATATTSSNTVINPANVEPADTDMFYFLCYGTSSAKIVKIQAIAGGGAVPSLVERETFTFSLSPESKPRTVVPLPWLKMFYVGLSTWPGIVVAFDVSSGTMIRKWSSWIATSDRYFSTSALVTPYEIVSTTTTTSLATSSSAPATTTTTTSTATSTTTSTTNDTLVTSSSSSTSTTLMTTTTATTTTIPSNNNNNNNNLKLIFATDSGAASAVQYLPLEKNFSTSSIIHYTGGQSLVAVVVRVQDYLYLASDTRPAIVTKMAADTLQNIANMRLPLGDDWIRLFVVDKFGFGHVGMCTTIGRLVRFNTATMTRISAIDGGADEECFHTAVFAPTLETAAAQILYVTTFYGPASAASLIKFEVTASGITRLETTSTTLPEKIFSAVNAPPKYTDGTFALVSTYEDAPMAIKINLQTGTVASTLRLSAGEGPAREIAVCTVYAFLALSPSLYSPGLAKIWSGGVSSAAGSTSDPAMYLVTRYNFGFAEPFFSVVPFTEDGLALLGTASRKIVMVNILDGSLKQVLDTNDIAGAWECGVASFPPPPPPAPASATTTPPQQQQQQSAANDPNRNIAWMVSYASPSTVLRIDTSLPPSSSSASPNHEALVRIAVGAGTALAVCLALIIALFWLRKGKNSCSSTNYNSNRNNFNETDEPMLQVPRTQVTTFHHTAMSVPTRDDMMYSDRVAVPPASSTNSYYPSSGRGDERVEF